MPDISVIVPVYKVEQYLRRCVDSILGQSFTNFELILVDDGSPDNCPAICNEYAKKDSRVRVIHQKNSGVSAARNAGLDIAAGDYITFVDADDFLPLDALAYYITEVNSSSVNLVVGGIRSEIVDYNKQTLLINVSIKRIRNIAVSDKFATQYDEIWKHNNMLSACGKLYQRSIVQENHLRFDEKMVVMEDATFVLDFLNCCDTVVSIPENTYTACSFVGRDSWLHRSKKDYIEDIIFASDAMDEFMRLNHISYHSACSEQIFSCFSEGLASLWSMPYSTKKDKIKKYRRIHQVYRMNKYQKFFDLNRKQFSKLEYCLIKGGHPVGLQILWKLRNLI